MITGLAHVCYTVSNLDASIDFYCSKLGMTEAFPFLKEDGTRFGVYIHAGGRNFIELFTGDLGDKADAQSYRHLCLEADDLEATVTELRARGVEVTDVVIGSDGTPQSWLEDPDGNRIELHQYTPQSKQTPWLK